MPAPNREYGTLVSQPALNGFIHYPLTGSIFVARDKSSCSGESTIKMGLSINYVSDERGFLKTQKVGVLLVVGTTDFLL